MKLSFYQRLNWRELRQAVGSEEEVKDYSSLSKDFQVRGAGLRYSNSCYYSYPETAVR